MNRLAALEEMRSLKSRHATVSFEDMLETLNHSSQQKEQNAIEELDEQDETLIKSIVIQNSKDYVRHIENDDDDFDTDAGPSSSTLPMKSKSSSLGNSTDSLTKGTGTQVGSTVIMPKFVMKPKTTGDNSYKKMCLDPTPKGQSETKKHVEENNNTTPNDLQALCATYDSDNTE